MIRKYIVERMLHLMELECNDGNCDDCEKSCRRVSDFLSDVSYEVRQKFNVECDYKHCGGFDSPGYDIDCYAMAFIDENGNLDMVAFQDERC